jgi:ubiquinone/menaquinone biosynthesis C-methylase UbiE
MPDQVDYRRHVLYYYSRFARYYDWGECFRRGTRHKAVALSGWEPGERVLDVCTGTGELALAFAQRGAEVAAVDLVKAMLDRAAAKAVGLKLTCLEMDAEDLGFEDKTFGVSTLGFALHHTLEPTQRRILAEMVRVTRKSVVIVEPNTPANPRLQPIWATVHSWIDESQHHGEWSRQDFAQTCRAVGLEVRKVQTATFGIHRLTLCTPR